MKEMDAKNIKFVCKGASLELEIRNFLENYEHTRKTTTTTVQRSLGRMRALKQRGSWFEPHPRPSEQDIYPY